MTEEETRQDKPQDPTSEENAAPAVDSEGAATPEADDKLFVRLDELSLKYHDLLGSAREEDVEERTKVTARIENAFWEILSNIPFKVLVADSDHLDFSSQDVGFINFGINKYTEEKEAILEQIRANEITSSEYEIMHFTDGLGVLLKNVRRVKELKALHENLERVENTLKSLPSEVKALLHSRIDECKSKLSPEDAATVIATSSAIDKVVAPLAKLKMAIKAGQMDSAEKRQQFIQLTRQDKDLRERRTAILRKYPDTGQITVLFKSTDAKLLTLLALSNERLALKKELAEVEEYVAGMRLKDIQIAMREEVSKTRTLLKVCARRARRNPRALIFQRGRIMTQRDIVEAMREIESYDPKLFDNRVVKRYGRPPFVIVPGEGNSIYDWANNVILVPLVYPVTPLESLANGIITYRDDVDSVGGFRELRHSFHHDIKENEAIRSSRSLMEKMISDYVTWITKEAQGYSVLSRETREWFELHIGPSKNDVKRPSEMLTWHAVKVRKYVKELEGQMPIEDTNLYYQLGVANGILGNWDAALEIFENCISRDKKLYDAYFNAGIAAHKKHLRKAAEFFKQYIAFAPQSWWSRKANEHIANIK